MLSSVKKMVLTAICAAFCVVLPLVFHWIPNAGTVLLPMHIPVLLCGFLCGWQWGLAVGFIAPLLRSLTLGVPLLFPSALCMAFELATYGLAAALLYRLFARRKRYLYPALLLSMIGGRAVWGVAMLICMGIADKPFGFTAFLSGAVTAALPGIVLQLILIPPIVVAVERWIRK